MLNRINYIDEIRGVAFLFMFIHHINYFKDVSNSYQSNYAGHDVINKIGIISRTIFIILVGVSLYESYIRDTEHYERKRIYRAVNILFHALIISIVSHLIFPNYGIKFGVLHFIGVASLISVPLVKHPKLCAVIWILLYLFGNTAQKLGNPILDTMLGTNIEYSMMMDYFPLIRWLPYVFLGIFISFLRNNPTVKLFPFTLFENIGKNSLMLYTTHITALLFLYKYVI